MLDASHAKASAQQTVSHRPARPKPEAATRVGNGKEILPGVLDGRSVFSRRIRELLAGFCSDMGGNPSEARLALARRASVLLAWTELTEARLANGEEFDVGSYVTAVNALRRLLVDVGLERVARDVTNTRPTIRERLLQEKDQAAA